MSLLADRLLGSSRTTDPRKVLALHQAVVAALAAAAEPMPAGTLYALVMPHGYSLDDLEAALEIMVRAGAVRRDGDLLTWCKP